MPLPYAQVKDLYDQLHQAGAVTQTMPEWSQQMGDLTGTDAYSEGLHDNVVRRASYGLDKLINASGLPDVGGSFGRAVGGVFGMGDAGEAAGRGIPRSLVDMAPLALSATGIGAPIGIGLSAALQGAHSYADTGSVAAGLTSTAVGALLPGVAEHASQYVLGRLGAKFLGDATTDAATGAISTLNKYLPESVNPASRLAAHLAGDVAGAGLMGAGDVAREALDPNDHVQNPFTAEFALNLGLQTLPFAALHAGMGALAGGHAYDARALDDNITATRIALENQANARQAEQSPPVTQNPTYDPTTLEPEEQAKLVDANARIAQITQLRSDLAPPEEGEASLDPNEVETKQDQLTALQQQAMNETGGVDTLDGTPVDPPDEVTHVPMVVTDHSISRDGKSGTFTVADHPDNENSGYDAGDRVNYSIGKFPREVVDNGDGTKTVQVPVGWHQPIEDYAAKAREVQAARTEVDEPSLPNRGTETDPSEVMKLSAQVEHSRTLLAQALLAGDPEKLHDAKMLFRDAQVKAGMRPIDDASLAEWHDMLNANAEKERVTQAQALEGKMNNVMSRIAQKETLEQQRQQNLEALKERVMSIKSTDDKIPDLEGALAERVKDFKGGNRPDLFWDTVNKWDKDGRKGSLDGLDTRLAEKARSRVKEKNVVLEAAKEVVPETQHVRNLVGSLAESIVERHSEHLSDEQIDDGAVWAQALGDGKTPAVSLMRKPHIAEMHEELQDLLSQQKMAPQAVRPMSAGQNWVWGLGDFNAATDSLNGKPLKSIGAVDGVMNEAKFRNLAGRGKPLNETELAVGKVLVPDAFDGKGNVDVRKLYAALKGREPVVETKELGEGSAGTATKQVNQLIHQLDTADPEWRTRRGEMEDDATQKLYQQYQEAQKVAVKEPVYADAQYSFLGPKAESDMPGYVEGLVRLPTSPDNMVALHSGQIKYSGPHFGSEDKNVLAFYRGYEETLPDGTKAFHVIEVQSDWGQARRRAEKHGEEQGYNDRAIDSDIAPHPLLKDDVWKSLALKAAIQHAREVGATKIILSDGETAMMTEGHDKALPQAPPEDWKGTSEAWLATHPEPTQSGGMRLAYDQTLPSALKKLTGDAGQPVELGTHDKISTVAGIVNGKRIPVEGSPVFRNPDGTPKSSITGRMYDLTTAFARQDEQGGGSTLGDPTRAPHQIVPYKPVTPDESATIDRMGLNKDGEAVMKSLTSDRMVGGLAKDLLSRFPEALRRILPRVVEADGPSSALRGTNNLMHVMFSRGILGMTDVHRNFEVMHELVHGLTEHALEDPKNAEIVKSLDAIRQRLVNALPKSERDLFDSLQKSNWYDRYAQGDKSAPYSDLGDDSDVSMKLYGLMNNSELLAQGFSSHQMRTYMESVKGERTTAWKKFTGFVRTILGLGEKFQGTAFDEFLGQSSRLMEAGEQVSQASNFLEGYFKQQGAGDAEAQRQSTRALGILQGTRWDLSRDGIVDTLTQVQPVPSREIIGATKDLNATIRENGADFASMNSVMKEVGFPTTKAGLDQVVESAMRDLGDVDFHNAMAVLPDAATGYIFAKLNDYRDVLDAVRGAVAKVNDGLLNVDRPMDVRLPVSAVLKTIDKLLASERMHDESVAMIQRLVATDPHGFSVTNLRPAPATRSDAPMSTPADFVEPLSSKAWKGFVAFTQQMGQLAKTNPETAELINSSFLMKPKTRWEALQMLRPFALDPEHPERGFSTDAKKRVSQVFRDPKMLAAVNKWIFANQKNGGDEVSMLDTNHPDVAKAIAGLSESQQNLVENAVRMHGAMKTIAGNFILNHMADIAAHDAVPILSENGGKTSANFQLTSSFFKTLAMTKWDDPQEAALGQQQLSAVQSNVTPDQFLDLTKFMQAEVTKWNAHRDFFAKNPDWATAKRYGNFLVEYMDGGKRQLAGVDSRKEADVLTRGKQVLDFRPNTRPGGDSDFVPSIGYDAAMRQKIADAQTSADTILQKRLSDEDFATYKKYNAATQLLTEASGGGIPEDQTGYARTRQLSKGAENLPWLENQFKWVQTTANYWNRQVFRAQSRNMLLDPDVASNKDIQQRLATHVDNMLTPDPEVAQKMTHFVSTWMLGFRPSTAMITASHSVIRHTAELTRLSGNPIDSFRRVSRAMGEIVGNVLGKGSSNPEHTWLMREADKAGERDSGWFDDENSNQEKVVLNFLDDVKGQKPQTLGQQISSAGGTYSRVSMWMFQQARRINEESAMYASYDYYREQGLSQIQARDKAFEFNHAVNTVGGTAQRPTALFAKGVPRTAAMAAYSLKSYVGGTIGQLGRYIMEGSPFAHENLTPAEKWNARKAAFQMLGMQTAAAGLLGLPGITSALAVLNQLFPQMNVNQKTREGVADLFGGDHFSTDMAMGGLPSMLGWDFHSRLTMGNVVPGVNELDGFQPSALMGAPLNLAMNWITGAKKVASGEFSGAMDLMPTAAKDMLKMTQATDPMKDFKGRPLFQPTLGESVGTVLGFRPTRLSDANTQARLLETQDHVANEKEGRFRQDQATALMQGNIGSVRQALLGRLKENPQYDVAAAGKDIAQAVEDMTFPRDLSREGSAQNSPDRQRLLSTFSTQPQATSEVARVQFKNQLLQRLGLPPAGLDALHQAQLADQLRSASPTLTRSQIRLQVKSLASGQRGVPAPMGLQ